MFSFLATNKSVTLKTRQIIKGGCQCKHILGHKQFHKFTIPVVPGQHLTKSVVISSVSQNVSFLPYCYVENCGRESKKYCLVYNGYNLNSHLNYNNGVSIRYLHVGRALNFAEPNKPSSKVEETVEVLKEKVKAKESPAPTVVTEPPKAVVKKTIKQKIVDEILHYYHGFRLLFIDIKVSTILVWRILNGKTLTRREHKLLVRTVGDMFRLVPFSVFIIVPFMEFLLPVCIKLFPGMLPSTFQTATEKEGKMKQSLKIKLEMAKFLQQTLDDMAVKGKGHSSQAAKEFAEFFQKVRTSGGMATNEEIMKFSKLFHDEITLDSLSRAQLTALCRVLELQPFGTTNFLRFQLRMKLRSLAADDRMIQKEGIDSLSQSELQQACRARGMRALGMSEERLKAQLSQWLDLSLNEKVPPSLLLLSRAFMLPETTTTTEKLAATISALPDTVGTKTKAVIGEREGKVDNKTKIEVIKDEVARIREERKEHMEEREQLAKIQAKEAKVCLEQEELVDKAPILTDKAPVLEPEVQPAERVVVAEPKKPAEKVKEEQLSTKDLEALEDALDTLGKDKKKMLIEKEELDDLREEMKDYKEDVENLEEVTKMVDTKSGEIKESVAAQRLYRKVNKMINNMDALLGQLEKKEKVVKEDLQKKEELKPEDTKKASDELLKIDELVEAIHKIQKVPDASRLERISQVLGKIDIDKDGVVKVDDVLRVLELIGRENVKLSKKQMDELIDLIGKEDAIKDILKDEKIMADDKALAGANQSKEKDKDKKDDQSPPKPPPTAAAAAPPQPSSSASSGTGTKTDSGKSQSSVSCNRKPPLTIDAENISPPTITPAGAPEGNKAKASLAPPVTQNIVMEPKDNNGIPKKL